MFVRLLTGTEVNHIFCAIIANSCCCCRRATANNIERKSCLINILSASRGGRHSVFVASSFMHEMKYWKTLHFFMLLIILISLKNIIMMLFFATVLIQRAEVYFGTTTIKNRPLKIFMNFETSSSFFFWGRDNQHSTTANNASFIFFLISHANTVYSSDNNIFQRKKKSCNKN